VSWVWRTLCSPAPNAWWWRLAEGEIDAARPTGTVVGVRVGCFPDLYAALAGDPPDQVITL
jgi:hypothetical protein